MKSEIWQWVKTAVSAHLPEEKVIFMEQGKPRPENPFVGINIISDQTVDAYEEWGDTFITADEVDTTITQHRTGTVNIQAFAPNFYDILGALVRSIDMSRIVDLNRENKISITRQVTDIQDITEVLGTTYEARGSVTFRFVYANKEALGDGLRIRPLDSVVITGNIDTDTIVVEEIL